LRRIIKVLGAMALMVVIMATIVSPAFATHKGSPHYGWGPTHGYAGEEPHYGGTDECLNGWATNNPNKDGYSYYCRGN
jgi:hypothetical protein